MFVVSACQEIIHHLGRSMMLVRKWKLLSIVLNAMRIHFIKRASKEEVKYVEVF